VAFEATAAAMSLSAPGRRRDDGTLVTERVFAVADGVDLGAGAGARALVELGRFVGTYPSAKRLARALDAVNFALWQHDDGDGALRSTITAAVLLGSVLAVAHVGDSRAYLVRGGHAYQLTSDEEGWAGTSGTDREPVQRLGNRPPVGTPHVRRYLLDDGDRLILCTDGMWRRVGRDDLVMAASLEPRAACELLCWRSEPVEEEASVVVVAFRENPPGPPARVSERSQTVGNGPRRAPGGRKPRAV
jgi:serine/threonine protein phosphatase PrpC